MHINGMVVVVVPFPGVIFNALCIEWASFPEKAIKILSLYWDAKDLSLIDGT